MPDHKYSSFREYDENRTPEKNFAKYVSDFTSRNVNSKDYYVRGYSREEFNDLRNRNWLPTGNDRYITRIVVFDEKYFSGLKFDENDLDLDNRIADLAGSDKTNGKDFDVHAISDAIAGHVINVSDPRGADDIAADIQTAKQKTLNVFLGNGDPTQAFEWFLDQKLAKEGITAFDEKKVQNFLNGINADLDRKMKPVLDVNSDFNKRRRFLANDVGAYDKIVNSLREHYPDVGKLNTPDLLEAIPGETVPPPPETTMNLMRNYLTLKDKVESYTDDVRQARAEEYEKEKTALPLMKKYLENACKLNVDSITKDNFEAERNAYIARVKEGNAFSHDLYNLQNTAKEYRSHNFLWRWFRGGALRGKMDRYQNELQKNGMNKDFVKMVRGNDYRESTVKKVLSSLQRDISGEAVKDNALASVNTALAHLAEHSEEHELEIPLTPDELRQYDPNPEPAAEEPAVETDPPEAERQAVRNADPEFQEILKEETSFDQPVQAPPQEAPVNAPVNEMNQTQDPSRRDDGMVV